VSRYPAPPDAEVEQAVADFDANWTTELGDIDDDDQPEGGDGEGGDGEGGGWWGGGSPPDD